MATLSKKKNRRCGLKSTKHTRRNKVAGTRKGGVMQYFGFPWDRQSCWMDSSLMAMFYPDATYATIYPYIEKMNASPSMHDIMPALTQVISELRTPGIAPSLHGIRSLFAKHFAEKRSASEDQRDAFQVENELGYVFYFVQELLHVMGVPPVTMSRGRSTRNQWILEIEKCGDDTPLEECLQQNYAGWKIKSDMTYLFIELVGDTVKPQEFIQFNGKAWKLTSMVVFDCSHFISYLKQDGQWYLYDDTRSMSHIGLEPYKFGQSYTKGSCRFQYGRENTFFFYVLDE